MNKLQVWGWWQAFLPPTSYRTGAAVDYGMLVDPVGCIAVPLYDIGMLWDTLFPELRYLVWLVAGGVLFLIVGQAALWLWSSQSPRRDRPATDFRVEDR